MTGPVGPPIRRCPKCGRIMRYVRGAFFCADCDAERLDAQRPRWGQDDDDEEDDDA